VNEKQLLTHLAELKGLVGWLENLAETQGTQALSEYLILSAGASGTVASVWGKMVALSGRIHATAHLLPVMERQTEQV